MLASLAGPLSAFFSSVTWAVGSARYAKLSETHSPFAVNFARALVAFPFFVVLSFVLEGSWNGGLAAFSAVPVSSVIWFALSMIASYGLGDVLFLTATQALGVPAALAIASAFPLWTAGAGALFRGETLAPLQWLGLILAVAGVILVILNAHGERLRRPVSGIGLRAGVALAVVTSFFWAFNTYAVAEGGTGITVAVANTIRMAFAMIYSTVFCRLLSPARSVLMPAAALKGSLGILIFESVGGSYLTIYGLTHSPLAIGATLCSLAPVLSVPVAVALGLEKLSWRRTSAVIMVVLGVVLLVSGR